MPTQTTTSFNRENATTTKTYFSAITITTDLHTDCDFVVYDTNSSSPKMAFHGLTGNFNTHITFPDTPREFAGTTIVITATRALIAGEIIALTFWGWEEELI